MSHSRSAAVPTHYRNCEESVLVLPGARIRIDGVETDVKPGFTTWSPTGVTTRIDEEHR